MCLLRIAAFCRLPKVSVTTRANAASTTQQLVNLRLCVMRGCRPTPGLIELVWRKLVWRRCPGANLFMRRLLSLGSHLGCRMALF